MGGLDYFINMTVTNDERQLLISNALSTNHLDDTIIDNNSSFNSSM